MFITLQHLCGSQMLFLMRISMYCNICIVIINIHSVR